MKRTLVRLAALALAAAVSVGFAQGFFTIGTGGVTGVYYPVGGATSKIVNDADVGMRLTVESLRTVMGLHPEPMHLVCDAEAGVASFEDIAGKRVSIGNSGSGMLNTVRAMLEAKGMSEEDFEAEYLRAAEAPDFLRDGRIDCFFYTVGIGGAAIQDITTTSDVVIVPLADDEFAQMIEEFPYYAFATVPAGTYNGQDEDVTLFGVKALFVTSTAMSEEDVFTIVSAILDNIDDFRAIHPALANLTTEDFLSGLGAPLHAGAERAYQEAGLQ
jgi:TRAP transporter TAXI family solute receptor